MRILMVCLGNICRSPIAEGILKHKAKHSGLNWIVESAGTESYHIGKPPHRFSQKVCSAHGVDISDQRARKFTPQDFEVYDKIYALAEDVYEEIKRIGGRKADMDKVDFLLNELHDNCNASVPDPWYGNEDGYLPVYEMIEKACDAIVHKYGAANQ
ncbi:MAG TPA: low molecular weight protein-tyrosine-phosphatase [Flavipsychrobacter sp.]|nr:low molecular weight protein-tyrosine-phosphatase [Flavipsychrobacter sp.]